MKNIKLTIREKGRYVEIPGIAAFRTPAKVDVTKVKLSLLIQSLHSCGVNNYELVSSDSKGKTIYTEEDFKLPEKKEKDSKIDNRLDRMETLLLKLLSKGTGKKVNSSEQITNRLNRIEHLLKKGSQVIRVTGDAPVIEELDDQYIPEIDVSDMTISGRTIDVIDKTDEQGISDAVDLLSDLTRDGGK